MSSARAVAIIKKMYPGEKVGHGGTLDPLASGVLVIGVGRGATKKLFSAEHKEKEYCATIFLGATSTTDDNEGEKTFVAMAQPPTLEEVLAAAKTFVGEIMQTPPIYSALKIAGRPAYKYARHNQEVNIKPRPALIISLVVENYSWPRLEIKVVTGPGVYIRALARDLGAYLRTGAFLERLERTRVGDFFLEATEQLPPQQAQPFLPQHI